MNHSYFKPRKRFSFQPHPYDLGTFIGLWHSHDDNHFLLKIYRIEEKEFADYYNYHLNYALENNLVNKEEFFRHVWQIVQIRIKHFEIQNPFSNNHGIHKESLKRLQQFEKYLKSIDIWDARPSYLVIEEKENIIQKQKEIIEELQTRLDELKVFEVSQKIRIEEGYVPTFIDLLKQIEKLELPSGRKLILSDHKIVYPRLIGKYFSDGGDDLSVETLRNYYVGKNGDVTSKGTEIKAEHKLFRIVPVSPNEK
ncbi:hypothetical protein [Pedobacter jamesrossensis]|uniref:Uncharacterized protein n=1 Tax=Pedobacter jamesrossensis TaxID=1908238 RepID=A0ABV8NF49_9SPHI